VIFILKDADGDTHAETKSRFIGPQVR